MTPIQSPSDLDCGSHSCYYTRNRSGMRTNGRCRCADLLISEIFDLRQELAHWTFERFKAREETLRTALQGILEIGKRDMTNRKYDVYFQVAQEALDKTK